MQAFFKKVQIFVLVCLLAISNLSYAQSKGNTISYQDVLSSKDASKIDTYWLAMNIYHEAGSEPLVGKLAVGIVTLNRVRDGRWPKSVREVVTQPQQFSWYNGGVIQTPKNKAMWEECYQVAKMLLTKSTDNVIMKLLEGATHFHAVYVKPDWSKTAVKVVQIGDHIFYRTRNGARI